MATTKKEDKKTTYVISSKNNPNAGGTGVAGLVFACGQARCSEISDWLRLWLIEHDYEITEE